MDREIPLGTKWPRVEEMLKEENIGRDTEPLEQIEYGSWLTCIGPLKII